MSRKVPAPSSGPAEGRTPDHNPGQGNGETETDDTSNTVPPQEQDVHALVLAFCTMVREGAPPKFAEFRKVWEDHLFSHMFEVCLQLCCKL
jgi:hypothetical protein